MQELIKFINNSPIKIHSIISSLIYIIIGLVIFNIVKKFFNRKTTITKNEEEIQKIRTVKLLIINVVKYVDMFIVIIAILAAFGVNVGSILAGLGIGTAIVGLAFQDFAKDIIAGISIIVEGHYHVGDTIEIDGFMGEVTSISLKSTRIRNYKGATKIVANRNMDPIINYSLNNSLAEVDICVSYDNTPEEVEKALNDLFPSLKEKIDSAKGDFRILGITKLDDSSVIYRIVIEVEPMEQYKVERIIRREIKNTFDKKNIKIPYPQVEVHNGK